MKNINLFPEGSYIPRRPQCGQGSILSVPFGRTGLQLTPSVTNPMKKIRSFLLVICFSLVSGQSKGPDTSAATSSKWFLPHQGKIQFAGGIGFLSLGVGYGFFEDKIESDIFFGFVPKFIGGDNLSSLTLKTTYFPGKIKVFKKYDFYPFSIGLLANYTFGNQFFLPLPEKYPDGYFSWPTALRYGIFTGGKVHQNLTFPKSFFVKGLDWYYEVGSNELYLVSYFGNKTYLSIFDILNLAFGVKISI